MFQQKNYADLQKWSILPIDAISDWSQNPFRDTSYRLYTNPKFIDVEGKDSLFFQTTKAYYTIFVPANLFIYIGLKKIFHSLSNFQVSQFLRNYSFWYQYFVIIVLSNIPKMFFYSFNHFQLLFSLTTSYKVLHHLCVTFIGIFFIFSMSFFLLA